MPLRAVPYRADDDELQIIDDRLEVMVMSRRAQWAEWSRSVPGGVVSVRIEDAVLAERHALIDLLLSNAVTRVSGYFGYLPLKRVDVSVLSGNDAEIQASERRCIDSGSIRLHIGRDMPPAALLHDRSLLDALVRLSLPTLPSTQRWFLLGLGAYIERLAHARLERRSIESFWDEQAKMIVSFDRKDFHDGASDARVVAGERVAAVGFCVLADASIRTLSANRKTLANAMRAISRRTRWYGSQSELRDLLPIGDGATGTTALTDLFERLAIRGNSGTIDGLSSKLIAAILSRRFGYG